MLLLAAVSPVKTIRAQAVTVNIASQPLWGPVSYDYVNYYYLPEAGAYYYVPTNQFIYPNGGNWLFAPSLPSTYHVDLFRTYKVVLNTPTPYLNNAVYVTKYKKYKNVHYKQGTIRNSRDKKYYVVKGHPGAAKVKTVKTKSAKPAAVKVKSNTPAASSKPKGNGSSGGNGSKGKGKQK